MAITLKYALKVIIYQVYYYILGTVAIIEDFIYRRSNRTGKNISNKFTKTHTTTTVLYYINVKPKKPQKILMYQTIDVGNEM